MQFIQFLRYAPVGRCDKPIVTQLPLAAPIVLLAIVTGLATAKGDAGDRPNFVVLFMDDAGYGDLGCYGHPTIQTPEIDRMAAEGTRFSQFYSASPACSASRYALLTGRLPIRSGFGWVLMPSAARGLKPSELTLAEGLQSAGYATACFGKWHLGNRKEFLPLQHGFDEYFGLPYSNDMRPPKWPDLPLIEGNESIATNPDQHQLTRQYTERALDFISRNQDSSFFCYLAYAMPHVPLAPGPDHQGKSLRGTYGDVMEEIDWSVGAILASLRKLKIDQKTLVVLTSDNGPWIIKDQRGGSAGLLRDGKGSTWEGGVREPFIAWWPGTVAAGRTCSQVATTMDLLPTFLRLAGSDIAPAVTVDGVDIGNLLRGQGQAVPRPPLYYYGAGMKLYAVRDGPWKLHVRQYSQTGKQYFEGRLPLLFHLEHDPSEKYDLSVKHPEIVNRLQDLIQSHRKEFVAGSSAG